MTPEVITVSALNEYIKEMLDGNRFLDGIYVRGELSNYKIYPSGHHYFTLKDQNASLRCVMFRKEASKLRFKPEGGLCVTAFGKVSVYTRDGVYQLYCAELEPEGLGGLFIAYEQLKAKLHAEGLFSQERKKPLPRIPRRIAVITSPAGAAVRDIIRVLGQRWPLAEVVVLPVRVQGAEAPAEIAEAIKLADDPEFTDLIITGRGGGSLEDLQAFNDERTARAISSSGIPVISAVGHEPDVTISDFVADLRAATPSNAAELAVPDAAEVKSYLKNAQTRMQRAVIKKLSEQKAKLSDMRVRKVMTDPTEHINIKRMSTDFAAARLRSAAEKTMAFGKQRFIKLATSLDAMSPLKTLNRGFSVASLETGKIISDVSSVSLGDMINLDLKRGKLGCRVERKTEV
ncbi:MAG: exodeoxyribonuclease VII large subunit [Oscillospiraceae bacterium]|nr:exodeoxyribonuclease VII large subunit [Oscillospiraceae bacterium]